MAGKNGFFQLCTKTDGLFLKLIPAKEGGVNVKFDEINYYLGLKKIMNFDIKAINTALRNLQEEIVEVKISDEVRTPENETLIVEVGMDKMSAIGKFYPPSEGGQTMSEKEIISELARNKVKYGIKAESIMQFMRDRIYCTNILLAEGKPIIQGTDAVIHYTFSSKKSAKPKVNEDGSVDFHQLDIISHVNDGDLIAELTPAYIGELGIDVYGNKVKPEKVTKLSLKYGPNINISDDKCKLYATVSGHVSLEGDKVVVSNTYEVPSDVDTSTGDINYDGNVTIKGNVITGFVVKAKGDIVVEGVVEGAELYAEGQIILKRGIQGMGKGILQAKSNIVSKFIENSTVKSGGYVTAGAILHSKVSATYDITVNGKKGFVTGGEVKSGTQISVKTAGSTMGTTTLLEVGIDPNTVEEFRSIEKEIISIEKEEVKIVQVLTLLKKKLSTGEKLSADKLVMLQTSARSHILLETKLKELKARYEELKLELDNYESGKIIVDSVIFPGVKLVISNVTYYIRSETKFCQFIREGADIKMIPHS